MDAIVEAGVDYVFLCGDLFERRTFRPHLVQFAHDELYRLARETEEMHSRSVKILVIRGNHNGRPQSRARCHIDRKRYTLEVQPLGGDRILPAWLAGGGH